MIVLKNTKARVDPYFEMALQAWAVRKRDQLNLALKRLPEDSKKFFFQENREAILNLKKMLEPSSKDLFLTELRSLPVAEFTYDDNLEMYDPLGENGNKSFQVFRVVTRDVIVEKLNMGPFSMYIPADDLMGKVTTHFHFVPEQRPLDHWRHPHHIVSGYSLAQSPTQLCPNTCFGSFNTVIYDMLEAFDFIGLVRILYAYLSRYNKNSPLPSWKRAFPTWREYENHCRQSAHAVLDDAGFTYAQRV